MWLIKASLRNPYMVAALCLMILTLGVLSLVSIAVDILPIFKAPAVQVITYYQGMPASSIEKTITNRIERWVNQAPGAAKVQSKSVVGVSTVKIFFRDDLDPNAALTMTNSLALGTLPTLPPNTLPPVVLPFDPTATMPLGILTVQNPSLDEAHVKDLARIDVRNMLGVVPGCVAPVVVGGKDRTVIIYLRQKDLQARNLSPLDVVEALRQGNQMVTPGTAYFGNNQVLLDTNLMVTDVKELNDFPIRIRPGDSVYLRDVGQARDSYSIQTSRVRINGNREVYVPIYRQQGASSLAVANGVERHIKYMEDRLPPGTKLELVMNQSFYVKEAILSLVHEGIIGACLLSVMILVFLGNWRMTLIACMSIPLSVLGAIVGLYFGSIFGASFQNTINAMTLGGLALAIGPLVDDAIVALENTHRNYHLGKSWIKAALDGCVEVMVPVLVATCTTIIVLAPLALMPGMGGFLFKPLALTVAFAMITSFILSRTFVPMMCSRFLAEEPGRRPVSDHAQVQHAHVPDGQASRSLYRRIQDRIDRFTAIVTYRYSGLLGVALRHRVLVLGAVLGLFLGSLCLTRWIGREFFPQSDAGQITIYVRAPSSSRLDQTERRVAQVERFVYDNIPAADRQMIVSEIGLDPDWSAAYSANSGQQDAIIRIQLSDKRSLSAQEYAIKLRHLFQDDRFADLRFSFDTGGLVSTALNLGASSPIDIEVQGEPPGQAFRLAKEIAGQTRDVRGAADVRVLQRRDAPYLIIDVDRQKAADEGLSGQDVIEQVVAAMNSSVSINRNFWIDVKTGNQYFVAVQYPESGSETTVEDILNVPATNHAQRTGITLGSLVKLRHTLGSVEINHTSLYRTFNVLINTANRDVGTVAADITHRLASFQKKSWEDALTSARNTAASSSKGPRAAETARHAHDLKEEYARMRHELNPGFLLGLVNRFRGQEQDIGFPGGLRVQLKGEYARMNESTFHLTVGLILAALLVYLLQVALFRSWVGPFIIMFTVPLGLIGVLTMLFLTHTTLNVQSQMGVIFLVGIAVNNGVLLVEFANRQRRAGLPIREAIVSAATIRFRPILMTFLATFLALMPMAIGFGRGSEANVPLARAVVGGLLSSTALTLFVVPIMYTLLLKDPLKPELDLETDAGPQLLVPPEQKEPTSIKPALALAGVPGAMNSVEGRAIEKDNSRRRAEGEKN
jgi:multidrug efflux pump subunit AcrB